MQTLRRIRASHTGARNAHACVHMLGLDSARIAPTDVFDTCPLVRREATTYFIEVEGPSCSSRCRSEVKFSIT